MQIHTTAFLDELNNETSIAVKKKEKETVAWKLLKTEQFKKAWSQLFKSHPLCFLRKKKKKNPISISTSNPISKYSTPSRVV